MQLHENIRPKLKMLNWGFRLMTNTTRILPDFLIIGTQRGGTTSLYYYLTEQTGIVSAFRKEVHYYDDHYAQGLKWYRAQFPTTLEKYYVENISKLRFLTGESSPYYMFHPLISKRLAAVTPHAKLIVLLRNPVDRAYSHHWLTTQEGNETLPFKEAVEHEEERLAGEVEKLIEMDSLGNFNYRSQKHRHYSYLSRGIYIDQLQQWMRFFPREQFLILKSEDLYADPAAILKQTLQFLGVPESQTVIANKEFKQYREPSKKGYLNEQKPPKMDPELRKHLLEYFRPHNARLYEFLGRDFGWEK